VLRDRNAGKTSKPPPQPTRILVDFSRRLKKGTIVLITEFRRLPHPAIKGLHSRPHKKAPGDAGALI
jgi:hypothetical protein